MLALAELTTLGHGETTQTITVLTADDYSVDVTFNGCVVSDNYQSTGNQCIWSRFTLCNGQNTTLDAKPRVLQGIWWIFYGSHVNHGCRWIIAEVTDGNCTVRDTVIIDLASVSLDLGPDTVICQGETLTLDAGPG